jgi:hypothetical protein
MLNRLSGQQCDKVEDLIGKMRKIHRPKGLLLKKSYKHDPEQWDALISNLHQIAEKWALLMVDEDIADRIPQHRMVFLTRLGKFASGLVGDRNFEAFNKYIDEEIPRIVLKLEDAFKNDLALHCSTSTLDR